LAILINIADIRDKSVQPPNLDAIDRKILASLQSDGRMSLTDLAAKVGLSPSPCLRRIRILERAGIIARYVAVLDQDKVGLPVSVFVSIKLESQRQQALDRFTKAIARWPEVLECYLMTGPRDYLLRVVVADLAAYDRFLKQKLTTVDGVASIESSFALEQVKYTNVLPIT
jgi:Lrp/AsnC family leucine-responsive transcriptional regulator